MIADSNRIQYYLIFAEEYRKIMTNLDSILKSTDVNLTDRGPSSQGYGFSSGHVWMCELDSEES